jgi:hypothetical protein
MECRSELGKTLEIAVYTGEGGSETTTRCQMDLNGRYFTTRDISEIAGISPMTLQNWFGKGIVTDLDSQNPGRGAARRYDGYAVMRLALMQRFVEFNIHRSGAAYASKKLVHGLFRKEDFGPYAHRESRLAYWLTVTTAASGSLQLTYLGGDVDSPTGREALFQMVHRLGPQAAIVLDLAAFYREVAAQLESKYRDG